VTTQSEVLSWRDETIYLR